MEIYYTITEQKRMTADGRFIPDTEPVLIIYGGIVEWNIHIRESVASVISWRAAIGSWKTAGDPVCRITGDEITLTGEGTRQRLSFSINTRTEKFQEVVQKGPAHACFELVGINANGGVCGMVRFPVILLPSIDPEGGDPLAVTDDLATVSWVKSLLLGGGSGNFVEKTVFDSKILELEQVLHTKLDQSSLEEYVDTEHLDSIVKKIESDIAQKIDAEYVQTQVERLERKISRTDLTDGLKISETSSSVITITNHTAAKYELKGDDSFTFDTSGLSADFCANMELWLTMKDSVKSFSFPADVVWIDGVTPKFDTANREYVIVLRWDGTRLLANLAYSVGVN